MKAGDRETATDGRALGARSRAALLVAGLLAGLAAAPPAAEAARTYYVSPNGSGIECSAAEPCGLAAGLAGATAGDRVIVAGNQGTYGTPGSPLAESFSVGSGVRVEGANGQPRPAIYTGGGSPALTLENGAALAQLEIHYRAPEGAMALRAGTQSTVERVTAEASGPLTAACGAEPEATLVDSICAGETRGLLGFVGGSVLPWPVTLRNDTIYGGAIGIYLGSAGPTYTLTAVNTIVHGGTDDISASDLGGGGHVEVSLSHSNFATVSAENGASVTPAGTGTNQTAPPLLADPAAGDFRELIGSPTIDAGANEAANGAFDLAGNQRTLPGHLGCGESPPAITDIGAFEFVPIAPPCAPPASSPSPPPPVSKPAQPDTRIGKAKIEGDKATFRFSGSGAGVTGFECWLDTGKWKHCRSPHTYKHLKPGKHRFRVRALNGSGPDPSPASKRFRIR